MASKRTISDSDGFVLIEVIMGAVLVLVVTVGLLSAFDGSTQASGNNKQRSIAASLAQTDQERMRTYTIAHLSNLRATVPVAQTTVAGVKYQVTERADWVDDNTGVANCTSSDTQGSYIEITSTVKWTGMRIQPVTVQSIVTPPVGSFGPGQGSMGVDVQDRNGDPVASAPVAFGTGLNDVTDANGCAVFGYIPTGVYLAQVSRSGTVDVGGNFPAKQNCSVPDGSTAICTFVVDVPTSAAVKFHTYAAHSTTQTDSFQTAVTFSQPKMTAPPPEAPLGGLRTFTNASPVTSITASNLFPFHDGYGVFAGSCSDNDPQTWATTPGSNIGTPATIPNAGPGHTPAYPVDVIAPSLNLKIMTAAGTPAPATASTTTQGIFVTPSNPACGTTSVRLPVYHDNTSNVSEIDPVSNGFPFGKFNICVHINTLNATAKLTNVANIDQNGTSDQTMTLSPGGSCP